MCIDVWSTLNQKTGTTNHKGFKKMTTAQINFQMICYQTSAAWCRQQGPAYYSEAKRYLKLAKMMRTGTDPVAMKAFGW